MKTAEIFHICIDGIDRVFQVPEGRSLLAALEEIGDPSIPVGCRGGGCGICRIRVVSGEYAAKRMSRAHVTEQEEQSGFALACRIFPASDLVVQLPGTAP